MTPKTRPIGRKCVGARTPFVDLSCVGIAVERARPSKSSLKTPNINRRALLAAVSEIDEPGENVGEIGLRLGHLGDGGIHFNLVAPPSSDVARDPAPLCALVFEQTVEKFNGSF